MEAQICISANRKRTFSAPWNTAWSSSAANGASRIICMLAALDMPRYSELRTQMGNITDAVLASTLKFLIANGIVLRKSYNEIPPRVDYTLSEKDHP